MLKPKPITTLVGKRVRINSPASCFHLMLGKVVKEDKPRKKMFAFGVILDEAQSNAHGEDKVCWFAYNELDWPIAPAAS